MSRQDYAMQEMTELPETIDNMMTQAMQECRPQDMVLSDYPMHMSLAANAVGMVLSLRGYIQLQLHGVLHSQPHRRAAAMAGMQNNILNYQRWQAKLLVHLAEAGGVGQICQELENLDKQLICYFNYVLELTKRPTSGTPTAIAQILAQVQHAGYGVPLGVADDCMLYVRNLPMDTTDLDLYKLFSPFGTIPPRGIRAMLNPDGTCNGIGFVDFTARNAALNAIHTLNDFSLPDGRMLHVSQKLPSTHQLAWEHTGSLASWYDEAHPALEQHRMDENREPDESEDGLRRTWAAVHLGHETTSMDNQ